MVSKKCLHAMLLVLGTGLPGICPALTASDDIAALSLEELANLEISSVSRKAESLASAAASVFVITAEDIRRHGATTLPEALRLAPNLQVARYGAGNWAISARGFNSLSANKLLVLIDGRIVYSPLHSGVFWDSQDVFMPDVERIEVISGPNATTWGSNAVNGVINIVMRDAGQTTGGKLAVRAGEDERVLATRVGDTTDGGVRYRVYGKAVDIDPTEYAGGASRGDDIQRAQAGFRVDIGDGDGQFTLQGDVYDGDLGTPNSRLEISGVNLLAHWRRAGDSGSVINVTGYYDGSARGDVVTGLEENLDIFGLSASHQLEPARNHSVVWGTDIRHARDDITNSAAAAFLPPQRNLAWISLFVQDEWHLHDGLSLILGARAEDNDYTGVEFMPNARLAWTPVEHHLLWTSVSRAVRTPARIDRDLFSPAEPPYLVVGGGDAFESEIADVVEIGYRAQPLARFSWSITAFRHEYDRLRTLEVTDAGAFAFRNGLGGTSTGIEGWWSWRPLETFQLDGGFFLFDKDLELRPGSTSLTATEGNDPERQLQMRAFWNMTARAELALFVRHVDALSESQPEVPEYTSLDARLGWRVTDNMELSLKVKNLLDDEHAEFNAPDGYAVYGRQAFIQLHWNYL
ncbi:MAG TPA: TonB-dependent receptor [Gammaproteobacteria bacterium]